jgi:uncharacterized protein (TIGR00725 family)
MGGRRDHGAAAPKAGPRAQIGIIGAGSAGEGLVELAREVGSLVAERGWTVLCGGLGGVMEAAGRGASERGGLVVGILPGESRGEGNPYLDVVLPTNMGHGRNVIIAQASDVLIAVGGGYGTLSEIALGLKMGKPVVSLRSWRPDPVVRTAESAAEAIEEAAGFLD